MHSFSYTLNQLDEAAQRLLQEAGEEKVWVFKGQMGAGKTTLIKSLAKALQVEDQVSSPTFGIVNEYQTSSKGLIFHFDFYRLDAPILSTGNHIEILGNQKKDLI